MSILTFLQNHPEISIRKMEDDLNITHGSIRTDGSRPIPKKHEEKIGEYLQQFGYRNKKYNEGRKPGFKDGIARFRDPENGLWKRYQDWCTRMDKTERVPFKGFEPESGEELQDEIGTYYKTTNGTNVYVAFN